MHWGRQEALSSAFQHAMPQKSDGKWETECLSVGNPLYRSTRMCKYLGVELVHDPQRQAGLERRHHAGGDEHGARARARRPTHRLAPHALHPHRAALVLSDNNM